MLQHLLLLQTAPTLQTDKDFYGHYLQLLEHIRYGQGCLYKAGTKFKDYFITQKDALENYQIVSVNFDAQKHGQFIADLNSQLHASYEHAFTRNELVVMSCLLAFPGLSFSNIKQKTTASKSNNAVRGMAFVSAQLERFLQDRLRMLKVVDDNHHPRHMEALSTVVLSSTYCYHQLMTWDYGEDWISVADEVLRVSVCVCVCVCVCRAHPTSPPPPATP